MKTYTLSIILLMICASGCVQSQSKADRKVGGGCEDCELMFEGMPTTLSSSTTIAKPEEPGERMIITGTIYQKDGKTPAPGVILYVYHTDNQGIYSPSPNQKDGKRHGHLRGWVKTDNQGRYQFESIRPASYPSRKAPQHIHPIIKESGVEPYWIDEYLFENDPLLTAEEKARQEKRGGPGIISLAKNDKGVWIGKRDIVLGMNVPGY
jgi:protocatechuate 3,4-dioxygenase, beta subunit